MTVAVIPARGGSKRIPGKNVRSFHGRPMISYAIKVAEESLLFDQIIVSTDDDEIASISQGLGASVPWMRSSELADDFATTLDVMQDAADRLKDVFPPETRVCCIYPATPLLQSKYVREGLQMINEADWDYVLSAVKNITPIQRSFTLNGSGRVYLNFPEHEFTRTQDLPPTFHDAGQFYWGSLNAWASKSSILAGRTTIVEIPNHMTVDIDNEEDWLYAEKLYSLLRESDELG